MPRHRGTAERAAMGSAKSPVPSPRAGSRRSSAPTTLLLCLVVALAAALCGFFLGHVVLPSRAVFGSLSGKTTLTEKQLDDVVGTYRVGREQYQVTAREALLQQGSLDAARREDGSYAMPSTEGVISAARTAILMKEAESRGITVSDDEVTAYAAKTFGSSDMSLLATQYDMDEATVRDRMTESATMAKLRQEVAPAAQQPPAEPQAPEDGSMDAASADYAAYILGLAGSEWDATRGTWASYDGPYASALKDFDVRADSATYAAAQTAYNVAYQQYATDGDSAALAWTEYVNGLLCKANFAVSTLAS